MHTTSSVHQTTEWLQATWRELLPTRIAIIAVDVSASMSSSSTLASLQAVKASLDSENRVTWADSLRRADLLFLTTFGNVATNLALLAEFSPDAIASTHVSLESVNGAVRGACPLGARVQEGVVGTATVIV